jgi:hypothetical protein
LAGISTICVGPEPVEKALKKGRQHGCAGFFHEPGGFAAIGLRLSEAIPPERSNKWDPTLKGSQKPPNRLSKKGDWLGAMRHFFLQLSNNSDEPDPLFQQAVKRQGMRKPGSQEQANLTFPAFLPSSF